MRLTKRGGVLTRLLCYVFSCYRLEDIGETHGCGDGRKRRRREVEEGQMRGNKGTQKKKKDE